jgi:hypothetical protein
MPRVLDMACGIIEHCDEHYGQLVVCYRLAGLVPPESPPISQGLVCIALSRVNRILLFGTHWEWFASPS